MSSDYPITCTMEMQQKIADYVKAKKYRCISLNHNFVLKPEFMDEYIFLINTDIPPGD